MAENGNSAHSRAMKKYIAIAGCLLAALAATALSAQITDCSDGYCSAPDYAKWINGIVAARKQEAERQRLAAATASAADAASQAANVAANTGSAPPSVSPTVRYCLDRRNKLIPCAAGQVSAPPKMTKREKWVLAAEIFTAVAGAATEQIRAVRGCRQVENKPLVQYRGQDWQNLRWCEANGY
jgi:hypothetical protein